MQRREPDVGDLVRVASGRVLMSADCDALFTSEDIGCVVEIEENCPQIMRVRDDGRFDDRIGAHVLILGKVVLFLRDHLEVVE